jgi:50S ribosomal protein L16 3-hydroxylase
MGVLRTWLGGIAVEEFVSTHLGRRPLAAPHLAASAARHCGWSVMDELLASSHSDTLVVARGELHAENAPRSTLELGALFARGLGVAVRGADRACAAVATLASSLGEDLPGRQRVIAFATPRNSSGFAWHFDAEEVFVVQTAGAKTYFFRANTVTPRPLRAEPSAFAAYRSETATMFEARLHPGDWLYLPSGYWHAAHAHEDSLSISIGVMPQRVCASSHSITRPL